MMHASRLIDRFAKLALVGIVTTVGCTGDDTKVAATSSGGDKPQDTCVHQAGTIPALAWSLVCGSSASDHYPGVAAIDGGVLFGFGFGNVSALPATAALDLGGGSRLNFGSSDILVGAFDKTGAHQWSEQWSDSNAQFFGNLATLGGERFALVGDFRASLTLGGIALPPPADPKRDTPFLAFLEGSGKYVTHRLFPEGTPDAHVLISAIVGGPNGEVAISGQFRESIDFGAGYVIAQDVYDGFVAVYESDGTLRFVRTLTGAGGDQYVRAVTFIEGGGFAITGSYEDALDVGDGAPFTTGSGPFLLTLSATGMPLFKRNVPGSQGPQYGQAVAVAPGGDLILGGSFLGTINLGGNSLVNLDQEQLEETNYDLFIARFNPQGVHRWSIRLGDAKDDSLLGVHVDSSGRVLVARSGDTSGLHVTAIDIQGGATEAFAAPVSGGTAAAFAADGSVYLAGDASTDVEFGAGSVANNGDKDVWLVRVIP